MTTTMPQYQPMVQQGGFPPAGQVQPQFSAVGQNNPPSTSPEVMQSPLKLNALLSHLVKQATQPDQIQALQSYLQRIAPQAPQAQQSIILGYLNSLKQEQTQPAQAPQQTVAQKVLGQSPQVSSPIMPGQNVSNTQPVTQMKEGGVATLPVPDHLYNFKDGGVVGFADAGAVTDPAKDFMSEYNAQKQAINDIKPVMPITQSDAIKQLPPEIQALYNTMPGQELTKVIANQAAQRQADMSQQQADADRVRQLGLSQALINAGAGTAGMRGVGALGGALQNFGQTMNTVTTNEMNRQQALKEKAASQELLDAKLKSEIQNSQQAWAQGHITDYMNSQNKIAEIQNEMAKLKMQGMGQLMSPLATMASEQVRAKSNEAIEAMRASAERERNKQGILGIFETLQADAKDPKSTNYGKSVPELLAQAGQVAQGAGFASAKERLQKEALDKIDKIREGYSMFTMGLKPDDPNRAIYDTNMKNAIADAIKYYKALGVDVPDMANTPAPATEQPSLLPTKQFDPTAFKPIK
jgi:hypothetical protein